MNNDNPSTARSDKAAWVDLLRFTLNFDPIAAADMIAEQGDILLLHPDDVAITPAVETMLASLRERGFDVQTSQFLERGAMYLMPEFHYERLVIALRDKWRWRWPHNTPFSY